MGGKKSGLALELKIFQCQIISSQHRSELLFLNFDEKKHKQQINTVNCFVTLMFFSTSLICG